MVVAKEDMLEALEAYKDLLVALAMLEALAA